MGKTYSTYGKMSNVLRIKVRRHIVKESPRRSGISRKVILKRIPKNWNVLIKNWIVLFRKQSIGRSLYEGRVALREDTKNTNRFFVEKPEGKRQLERPRYRHDDITVYPTKWDGMIRRSGLIWLGTGTCVINEFPGSIKCNNSTSQGPIRFSTRNLLHDSSWLVGWRGTTHSIV